MAQEPLLVTKKLIQTVLIWFQEDFRNSIVSLVESQFPDYPLPTEIQSILDCWEQIRQVVETGASESIDIPRKLAAGQDTLFKHMLLRYRRQCAAQTEAYREKTFHPGIINTLNEEITALDAIVATSWFQKIQSSRPLRGIDFLPIQYIEQLALGKVQLAPRQFDEKFHILQAPALFLQDLAYFRNKCEVRDAPLSIAFLDIDDFKRINSAHGETKVDRNVLPRFMQTIETHVYHHGFAYRQGGDEYLVLLPSLSKELAMAFFDELRRKLAALPYPEIEARTTVSIGVAVAQPDCPLTDRELRDRANQAKNYAKDQGKNCIASYRGPHLVREELQIMSEKDAVGTGPNES